jgi:hypothetical protein
MIGSDAVPVADLSLFGQETENQIYYAPDRPTA